MASREATPPPIIGKAGNLTVFITPSPSPKRNPNPSTASSPSPSPSPSPRAALSASCPSPILNLTPSPRESPVSKTKTASVSPVKEERAFVVAPPPVQVPPKQYEKGKDVSSHGSAFGFFWDAVARVQEAHSSLDEYLANWFGLDQSKYQWALNDYYETNTKDMDTIKGSKPKDVISKGQAV